MSNKKQKNGKIELLRFFFCMSVLLYHLYNDYSSANLMLFKGVTMFTEGSIGVQFFFLTSGYLTAMGIYKKLQANPLSLENSTWTFMKRKILSFLPYHILTIICVIAFRFFFLHANPITVIINGLPNMFFLQMTGLPGKNLLSVEWYISSMLMALLIIYPICKKYYSVFSRVVAPLLGSVLVGFLVKTNGSMGSPKNWIGFTYAGNFMALGCICLGVFSFELIRQLKENGFFENKRLFITIAEIIGYFLVLVYMVSDKTKPEYGGIVTFLLCILVGISFSEEAYGQKFYNNRFFCFLGKFSLPVYLTQNLVRAFFGWLDLDARLEVVISLEILTSFIFSFALMLIVDFWYRFKDRRSKKLPPEALAG